MGSCFSGPSSNPVIPAPPLLDEQPMTSMPKLFKRQSEEAKKRQQHQQYLAKESPDPWYDLSGCELYEVPKGVFSLCKVLQKESLLLYNNSVSSLTNRENSCLTDLLTLRVLDLHDNCLDSLPDNLGTLRNLQVLNLEGNKLKSLPDSINELNALQTLNVRRNKLKCLPTTISEMKSLRFFDISENNIHNLPQRLCFVRTLEHVMLDTDIMQYPSKDVCIKGTKEIMQFLCSQCGLEYVSPSQFVLPLLDGVDGNKQSNGQNDLMDRDNLPKETTIQQYEKVKEQKRLERLELERRLEEEQRCQAELSAIARARQKDLLDDVAQEQCRLMEGLSNLQQQKDVDRQKMVAALQQIERGASDVIQQLLDMSEKARHNEALLEAMERERIEAEQWFIVREEEQANLRKQEILVNMEKILEENRLFEAIFSSYMSNQSETVRRAQESLINENNMIQGVLSSKQAQQSMFLDKIVAEEKWQRQAFEALQLQKDCKHQRITGQIELIEYELAQLTLVEVERRQMKVDTEMNILAEKRIALSEMLMQLIDERVRREEELKNRLVEMEQCRMDTQTDYWLVQFQRLLDMKPAAMIDQENKLEFAVKDILICAGASDFVPLFARHRISIETMMQLSEDDMKQMGVHELGLRRAIMAAIQDYHQQEKKAGEKEAEIKGNKLSSPEAAAEEPHSSATPTAPELPREVKARVNTECVICMDNKSTVIFLNCGHVCCCDVCSVSITECPLCRETILQRIVLQHTYEPFNQPTKMEDKEEVVHMV